MMAQVRGPARHALATDGRGRRCDTDARCRQPWAWPARRIAAAVAPARCPRPMWSRRTCAGSRRVDVRLHAFVDLMPSRALAAARAQDDRAARGAAAGPARRRPGHGEERHRGRGPALRDRQPVAPRRAGQRRRRGGRPAARRRRDRPRHDQRRRDADGLRDGQSRCTARTRNPWDLDRTPGGSSGGEVGRDCRGLLGRRHRQRWRRIDPGAGALHRHLRAQAHARARARQPVISRPASARSRSSAPSGRWRGRSPTSKRSIAC